ncbi:MAG: transcription elongation factor GreA [Clostridia bacterium]|nr:transcription elongation factor GreA [Clostridia bacterium]MBR4442032.1 transcription elongation factor GreA [Clostridia bacterium]
MAVLTKEGLQKLQEELDDLQVNQRAEVVREIETAKGFGDLSENAEYSAARERQSRIEGRIQELQEMIEHAELIETAGEEGVANVGSIVKVFDLEYEEEDEYRIVGATEADPAKLFISSESPIGAALIGARAGDVVEVETPGGLVTLRVISVEH